MSDQTTLVLALVNAGILIAIAMLFLVIHLRGGLSARREDAPGSRNTAMLALGLGFLVAAILGVILLAMRAG